MSDKGKNKDCICGITCEVESCIHNNYHCGCTAKNIKVGPHFAATCNDTICQSYKKQDT